MTGGAVAVSRESAFGGASATQLQSNLKLAIMQPYFFPYLGYFSLIRNSDRFVLLDAVQFIRHGWIERNRILKPADGWQYIAVPLQKHDRETPISQIAIRNNEDWRDRLVRQLQHYKRAPFYVATMRVVEEAISIETDSIVALNANALSAVCAYLGIPLRVDIYSQMAISAHDVTHPGEWALNISKALGATEYINPAGGMTIFRKEQFDAASISLRFLTNTLQPYRQRHAPFEPGLSIIDVMMFNDVPAVNSLIDATEFVV